MTNQYQYDSLNRLTNLNWNLSLTALAKFSYTLGATGNRTNLNETVGTTNRVYAWQYDNLYRLTNEAMTVNGSDLINQREPGVSTNYFIYDGHSSTRMLTDNGGTVVNVLVYDAFGNLIASNGTLQTAYLYSGQQYDPDLGLYYNRARFLNMGTGRFWSADSTEGDNEDPLSLHKYLYAADDPVNNSDPSGNDYGAFDININSIFNLLVTIAANLSSEGGTVSGFGSGSGTDSDYSDDTSELSAGRPSLPPHVIIDHKVPPDHMTFTALDGEKFYAPPGIDFRKVDKEGASINDGNSDITAALHYSTIKNHCAQWGSLDYQRNNGHGLNPPGTDNIFYTAYTHASNYAVGVYMQAAGFTMDEIKKYAGGYAAKNSSNAKSADLVKWWGNGFDAAKSGTPNGLSSPVP